MRGDRAGGREEHVADGGARRGGGGAGLREGGDELGVAARREGEAGGTRWVEQRQREGIGVAGGRGEGRGCGGSND